MIDWLINWWRKLIFNEKKILECISPGLPGAGRSTYRASTKNLVQFTRVSWCAEGSEVCKRYLSNGKLASMVCSLCLATAVKISCNDRWGDIYDVRFILLFPSPACFLFVRSNSGGTNVLFHQKNKELSQNIHFIHLFLLFYVYLGRSVLTLW